MQEPILNKDFLFTSESVSEGHPDKVADQVSDGVLDAILAEDPAARVACETLVSTGLVVISGEITTAAHPNYREIAQDVIRRIGYDNSEIGFDYKSCAVLAAINRQSPDIAQGVNQANDDPLDQGAGDQGLMFGYACSETPSLMPFPIYFAHRLMQRQAEVRKDGRLPWLRPDAKSQLTVKYVDGRPAAVDTVVLSTQHDPDVPQAEIREAVIEHHQAGAAARADARRGALPGEPDRPLRRRRPARRLRPHRAQDHRRHLRRRLPARRRRVQRQGPVEGRPLGGLRRALRREERGRGRPGAAVPGAGGLRDRRGAADEHHRLHRGHR
jgi:hypothetical protein